MNNDNMKFGFGVMLEVFIAKSEGLKYLINLAFG